MNVEECMRNRRSIRKYLSTPIGMDKIGRILDSGRLAPTAGNLQNYKFVLIRDPQQISKVADACVRQYWIETAPVIIVIVSEPQRAKQFYGERGEKAYSIMNCATIAQNMALTAKAIGLGSCIIGAFDARMLSSAISAPDYVTPELVMTVGYPDEKVPTPERYKLTDMTFFERWGAKIANLDVSTRVWSSTVESSINKGKTSIEKGTKTILEQLRDKTIKAHRKIKEQIEKRKQNTN